MKKNVRVSEEKLVSPGLPGVQVATCLVLTFDSTCDWQSVPVVSWTRA